MLFVRLRSGLLGAVCCFVSAAPVMVVCFLPIGMHRQSKARAGNYRRRRRMAFWCAWNPVPPQRVGLW